MKYGKKTLFLLTFILGFVTLLLVSGYSFAQSPNYDVTVSPVFFDLSTNPEGSVSDRIRIRNNTTSPLPIQLEVKRLTGDVNGDLTLRDDSDDSSLSWISFNQDRFVAKPLEWTDVTFTIQVPKEAAYGYYYAVTFKQDEASPLARTGAAITGAAAVPILLNVRKEGAKIQGNLLSFRTDSNYYEYPPINFITTFQNTGNVHIRPTGNIFVRDMFGRQVATLGLNTTGGAILPNTKKDFEDSWSDSFITSEPKLEDGQIAFDKNGKIKTELKIRFDKILDLRIGKYTATALMVVSTAEKDIPYEAEISFFVFPWKVVLGVVLFMLFAGYGFLNTAKNLVKRILRIFKREKKPENPV